MANTMLNGMNANDSLKSKFNEFKRNIERSGKDPKAILNELISSGKVSKEQIEKAKALADKFGRLW